MRLGRKLFIGKESEELPWSVLVHGTSPVYGGNFTIYLTAPGGLSEPRL